MADDDDDPTVDEAYAKGYEAAEDAACDDRRGYEARTERLRVLAVTARSLSLCYGGYDEGALDALGDVYAAVRSIAREDAR